MSQNTLHLPFPPSSFTKQVHTSIHTHTRTHKSTLTEERTQQEPRCPPSNAHRLRKVKLLSTGKHFQSVREEKKKRHNNRRCLKKQTNPKQIKTQRTEIPGCVHNRLSRKCFEFVAFSSTSIAFSWRGQQEAREETSPRPTRPVSSSSVNRRLGSECGSELRQRCPRHSTTKQGVIEIQGWSEGFGYQINVLQPGFQRPEI